MNIMSKNLLLAEQAIRQHDFITADKILNSSPTETIAHERWRGHLQAQIFLFQTKYQQCESKILKTQKKYGDHILLKLEKANVYYLQGKIAQLHNILREIELDISHLEKKLQDSTKIEVYYHLAKHAEEDASISKALFWIQKGLNYSPELFPNYYLGFLSQKIRILSCCGSSKELSISYNLLRKEEAGRASKELSIEINHAMILAEAIVLDFSWALKRFEAISNSLPNKDFKWILFDLIDLALLKLNKKDFQQHFQPYFTRGKFSLLEFDFFEKTLLKIAKNKDINTKEWLELSKKLSRASLLRIFTIFLKKEKNILLQNNFLLLTKSLDRQSRHYWLQRIENGATSKIRENKEEFYIDENDKKIFSHSHSLNLNKKPQTLLLCLLLAEKEVWKTYELVESLWKENLTVNHFDRLRILISRTNQLFEEYFGHKDGINFSKRLITRNILLIKK